MGRRAQEESIKTFAMRPALEWAVLKLHDSDATLAAQLKLLVFLFFFGSVASHWVT